MLGADVFHQWAQVANIGRGCQITRYVYLSNGGQARIGT
jgi:hypothetical protein